MHAGLIDCLSPTGRTGRLFQTFHQCIHGFGEQCTSNRHFQFIEGIFQGTIRIKNVDFRQGCVHVGSTLFGAKKSNGEQKKMRLVLEYGNTFVAASPNINNSSTKYAIIDSRNDEFNPSSCLEASQFHSLGNNLFNSVVRAVFKAIS